MGGGFALLMAARGFDVSAPYYGQLPKDNSALDGACPVVASFGGRDITLRGAADKLDTALTERDITHDVKEYPGSGHCFANRIPGQPVLRVLGVGYQHSDAEDAWRRVSGYFATHLH
jgi:carboxymethylenebutenolidase